MTNTPQQDFDSRLLDLHLGHLSVAEQQELRRRIADDPRLAAQNEALASVFAALRCVPDERAPHGLAEQVCTRVRQAGPAPRIVRPADKLTASLERQPERVLRLSNLRDIVAVAAMIVLAVGLGVPSLMHMRERQQRLGCSWNLAQLGRGVQQYASTFNASLPFAGWSQATNSWAPSTDQHIATVPNRRHMYPLLRQAFVIDPRLFICPAQRGVPMPVDAIQRHNDFLEGRNVNYAYQNMSGVRPSANGNAGLPILSDENPLFDEGLPLFDAARLRLTDPAAANSRSHGGAGQNVLTIDGRVQWTTTPLTGVNGDNIWTLINITDYTGQEGPTAATDSHLLK
jgi:hypothetical protein